jgi:hypothetical protein
MYICVEHANNLQKPIKNSKSQPAHQYTPAFKPA